MSEEPRPIIVGITGASGAAYGVRALELLREVPEVETHLVMTRGAMLTIHHELEMSAEEIRSLADVNYRDSDLAATIASGSFRTRGMLVMPCSVKTLSAVANSYAENLVVRAADVTLKERRPLVLLVRETPLHAGHLRLMSEATAAGAVIMPPVPAFYSRPQTLQDMVDHTVGRTLDLLGIDTSVVRRWTGAAPDTEDRPPGQGVVL